MDNMITRVQGVSGLVDIYTSDHGREYECIIQGRRCTGKVTIQNGIMYLCQNQIDGSKPRQTWGYRFGWQANPDVSNFRYVSNFRFIDSSSSLRTAETGSVIIDEEGYHRRICGRVGDVVFFSVPENFKILDGFALVDELEEEGWEMESETLNMI